MENERIPPMQESQEQSGDQQVHPTGDQHARTPGERQVQAVADQQSRMTGQQQAQGFGQQQSQGGQYQSQGALQPSQMGGGEPASTASGGQHAQEMPRVPPPMRNQHRDHSNIPGWGADLDHANRPAYPRERMPARLEGLHWDEPEQQPVHDTVFHSTERPGITPVFGTSTPPMGLSGRLRNIAYGWSENDIRHWMLLLLADRINVVEGIGEDLRAGYVPNLYREFGWRAEKKYNPGGFARKMALGTAVVGLGVLLLARRGRRRNATG